MYTVDGLLPDGDGWQLFITGSGIRGTSGRQDAFLVLPGMDGAIPSLDAPFMPGTIPLRYRIFTDNHAKAMEVIEKFNGLFGQRRKLLPVTHDYGGGVTRVNDAIVIDATPPEVMNVDLVYYMVTLQFPNPFWRSATAETIDLPALTTTFVSHRVPNFAGTGPISDAWIRVKGGFSTAFVRCPITNDEIRINTPATAGQYILIDTANWASYLLATDTWTPGGTDISHLVHSSKGRGAMFTMEPDQILTGGRYRLQIRATNPTNNPILEVRARMSYH